MRIYLLDIRRALPNISRHTEPNLELRNGLSRQFPRRHRHRQCTKMLRALA